jgi:hypothetical protein
MAYEVDPNTSYMIPESRFQAGIERQINIRGDDNHPKPDRYNPVLAQSLDYDHSYGSDGQISFGDNWQTHRMDVGDVEVVYAYKPRTVYKVDDGQRFLAEMAGVATPEDGGHTLPSEAEFYVYEFVESGVAARTEFVEHGADIFKGRVKLFNTVSGIDLKELSRPLRPTERDNLDKAIEDPEANSVALQGLVRLSGREARAVRRARADHDKREKEHRQSLDDVVRSRREALRQMREDPKLLYG